MKNVFKVGKVSQKKNLKLTNIKLLRLNLSSKFMYNLDSHRTEQ